MALERTVTAKLRVEQEGEAEAFSEVTESIGEMEESASAAGDVLPDITDSLREMGDAAHETADALPDISEALEDVSSKQEQLSEKTGGSVKQIHSLADIFKVAGGEGGQFALKTLAVVGALDVASKSLDKAINGLNELSEATGGSSEAFERWGPLIFPKESFDNLVQALTDTKQAMADLTGETEKQIQKQTEVREKYQEALTAHHEQIAAAKEAAEAEAKAAEEADKAAQAAVDAAEKQAAADDAAAAKAESAAAAILAQAEAIAKKNEELAASKFGEAVAKQYQMIRDAASEAAAAADRVLAAASGKDFFGNPTQFGYGAPGGGEGVPGDYTFPGAPGSSSAGGGMG